MLNEKTTSNFRVPNSKICIVGNLNVDLVLKGATGFPQWGQEMLVEEHTLLSAGQGANMALAYAKLGGSVAVIGNVGDDQYGEKIISDLRRGGVDVAGVDISSGFATGLSVCLVREDGERAFISNLASLTDFREENLLRHEDIINSAAITCFVGTFALPELGLDELAGTLKRCKEQGQITMLDTGWDPANWPEPTISKLKQVLKHVTIFIPNYQELKAITGSDDAKAGVKALAELGPKLVVAKLGSAGSMASYKGKLWTAEASPTTVYDTVGAGDMFDAAFLRALQIGKSIKESLVMGNAAASICISRREDKTPTLGEVLKLVGESTKGGL